MRFSSLAMVLTYSTSVWGATKTDRETTEEITTTKRASSRSGKFVKHLLGGGCAELKAIQNHVMSFRTWIKTTTLPYTAGAVLMPIGQVLPILRQVKKFKEEFYVLVDQFVEQYEQIVEKAKVDMGDLFNEDVYPTKSQVRRKFDFHYMVSPIPESNQFDSRLRFQELEKELAKQYELQMEEKFQAAEQTLIDRLAAKLNHVYTSMKNYSGEGNGRSLSSATINSAVTELASIKSLNIRSNADVNRWCDEAAEILSLKGSDYRNNSITRVHAMNSLKRLLDEIGYDSDSNQITSFAELLA